MDVVREVARAPNGLDALVQVIRYILEVNEHVRSEELQALLEHALGPQAKDVIVPTGQQFIEQGIEQTRRRFQGVLLRLLRQRFGDHVDAQIEQRVAASTVEQLEAWSSRVLSATTLAELFAD
ncbi:MAG TPA: DUF4351 domain-containing protein [Kofleriaceae bacterium]|nr:DUF4351 domain-containing protein [Kofleriaceae bacterium]